MSSGKKKSSKSSENSSPAVPSGSQATPAAPSATFAPSTDDIESSPPPQVSRSAGGGLHYTPVPQKSQKSPTTRLQKAAAATQQQLQRLDSDLLQHVADQDDQPMVAPPRVHQEGFFSGSGAPSLSQPSNHPPSKVQAAGAQAAIARVNNGAK